MSAISQNPNRKMGENLSLPHTMGDVTSTSTSVSIDHSATTTSCPPVSVSTSKAKAKARPQLVTESSSASSSSLSTTSTTTSSSPSSSSPQTPNKSTTHPKYACQIPQLCPKTGQTIDALSRHYPKPEEEIDIGEALERGPLPGRYWVVKEQKEDEEGNRREEFERVKRVLRAWG